MEKDALAQLVNKYINGKCTSEEIEVLYDWYESRESALDPIDTLSDEDKDELKALMMSRIRRNIGPLPILSERKKVLFPFTHVYALTAAAAVFVLVMGLFFFNKQANRVSTDVSGMILVNNQTSKIFKQILSDGSIVWLNPQSTLEYPKKFSGALRSVKMQGEAFFEVTKDHKHPFVIYSGGVVTRVWGTSFRIRKLENTKTEVSVITGKVSVKIPSKENSEVMLLPDQKVTYKEHDRLLKKEQEQSASSIKMWKKTNLSFENVSLKEVIAVLNKRFNCELFTKDQELEDYLLKADFNDQRLPDILEMLEKSLDINYRMDDNKIILIRKRDTKN